MSGCREECEQSGEPLAGSAGAVYALVAISWPKPLWDPSEKARSSGLPAALAELEAESEARGRKLAIRLFQRDERPSTEYVELVVTRRGSSPTHTVDVSVTDLVDRLRVRLDGGDAPPLERRLVLVCTDGKHDRCCATHGRPLLLALRSEVDARGLACDVVESSHLGGHRFAANALVLPDGHLYGRLGPEDAGGLADALQAGRVFGARYRGRIDLSDAAQTAEACLRARHPEATAIEPGEAVELGEGSVRVGARVGDAETSLELVQASFNARSSCSDEVPRTQTRWVVRAG